MLSPIREDDDVQLGSQGSDVYALGYTHALARTRLYRFSRAGGPVELVAEQKGIGENKLWAMADGAAYYVQAGKLFKLGPAKGSAVELYNGVHSPVAIVGDQVFAVACDSKGTTDHLLQIPRAGGPAETIAELSRASKDRCQYSSLAADERDVFIADWNGSRILSVSRSDKSVHVIVTKKGFPGSLILGPTGLTFLSARGLFHVDREGGAQTAIASENIALAPWSVIRASNTEYWIFDAIAYTVQTTLFRVPLAGGAPKVFTALHNADPNAANYDGQGLRDFTIDDECAYIAQAQYKKPGAQIIAMALN